MKQTLVVLKPWLCLNSTGYFYSDKIVKLQYAPCYHIVSKKFQILFCMPCSEIQCQALDSIHQGQHFLS